MSYGHMMFVNFNRDEIQMLSIIYLNFEYDYVGKMDLQ